MNKLTDPIKSTKHFCKCWRYSRGPTGYLSVLIELTSMCLLRWEWGGEGIDSKYINKSIYTMSGDGNCRAINSSKAKERWQVLLLSCTVPFQPTSDFSFL